MDTSLCFRNTKVHFCFWICFRFWKFYLVRRLTLNTVDFNPKPRKNPLFCFNQFAWSQIPSLRRFLCTDVEGDRSGLLLNGMNQASGQINSRILDIYGNAERSELDALSFSSAVAQFHELVLMEEKNLRLVNLATMIHRLGRLTRRSNGHDILFSRHALFLAQLLVLVQKNVGHMKPQAIGNISWGLGLMGPKLTSVSGVDLEEILSQMASNTLEHMEEFKAQNLSNFLLGLVGLENKSCRFLLSTIMGKAKTKIQTCNSQELTNIIWALTKLGYIDRTDFIPRALEHVDQVLDTAIPKQLASLLWSLANLQISNQNTLVEKITLALLQSDNFVSSQTIGNIFWSLLQLKFRPSDEDLTKILQKCDLFTEFLKHGPQSSNQVRHLSNTLMTLADFGCWTTTTQTFMKEMKKALLSSSHFFNSQDICNTLWSMAIIDDANLTADLLTYVFQLLQDRRLEKLEDKDIRQCYQCLLHFKVFRENKDNVEIIPSHLEIKWRTVWSLRQATSPLPLWMAHALLCLEIMGYSYQGRFLEQGLVNTCQVQLGDRFKYCIEGISFTRSFRNLPGIPTARYRWKVRLLERLGYEVIAIEENQWISLLGEKQRRAYLQERIQDAQTKATEKFIAELQKE